MLHAISRRFFRDVLHHTVRMRFLPGASGLEGGYILACNHPSHLDPIMVSLLVRRKIHWMARIEFYGTWWSTALLNVMGAFPVNREGFALGPIRKAMRLIRAGRVVGICPEGEVRRDRLSILRGGSAKHGACLIAQRTGRPIVPCVVLGTEALLWFRVYRMSKPCYLWMACGDPIHPPSALSRREGRRIMAEQLEDAMRCLHQELRRDIADSWARKRREPMLQDTSNERYRS
jgi:1-acyl-sn-glycerol-3-phosphate acyltransferase